MGQVYWSGQEPFAKGYRGRRSWPTAGDTMTRCDAVALVPRGPMRIPVTSYIPAGMCSRVTTDVRGACSPSSWIWLLLKKFRDSVMTSRPRFSTADTPALCYKVLNARC
jgi:hypothetical protein